MKVSLFITCLNDTLYPQTGIATVNLLERLGCEISRADNDSRDFRCFREFHHND
jgi:L-lactate dehydrogenase complex protein LldE